MNIGTLTARSAGIAFVAGVIATLVPHQLVLKLFSVPAYSMAATWPLGVPSVFSLAFFGGLWAILLVWLVPRLPAPLNGVIGWIVAGAVLPTLVLLLIVAPLKGIPLGVLFSPGLLFAIVLAHAVWGLCSWALIKGADMAMPQTA